MCAFLPLASWLLVKIRATPVTLEGSQKIDDGIFDWSNLLIMLEKKQKYLDLNDNYHWKISVFLATGVKVWSCLSQGHNRGKTGRWAADCHSEDGSDGVLFVICSSAVCRGNVDRYMSSLVNRSDSSIQTKETDASPFLMEFRGAEGSDMRQQKHHVCQSAALISSTSNATWMMPCERDEAVSPLNLNKKKNKMSESWNYECSLLWGMCSYTAVSHLEDSYSQSHFPETTCDWTNLEVHKVRPVLLTSYSVAFIKI